MAANSDFVTAWSGGRGRRQYSSHCSAAAGPDIEAAAASDNLAHRLQAAEGLAAGVGSGQAIAQLLMWLRSSLVVVLVHTRLCLPLMRCLSCLLLCCWSRAGCSILTTA